MAGVYYKHSMAIGTYTAESIDSVFSEEKTREGGLSKAEAEKRLALNGQNVISAHAVSWFALLIRQVKSPFIYILFCAALAAIFLGEISDGMIIIVFVLINTFISFFQEYHSARSLALLKKFINPRARVRRDGVDGMVDAALLVPGDVIIVETGDIIPADIRFIEVRGLSINESALTGESVPAIKTSDALKFEATSFNEATNRGFSGTTVTGGRGVGIVIETGPRTEIGKITTLTVETEHVSEFERSIGMFSKFILKMVTVILVVLILANVIIKGTSSILDLLLFAVALAISVIPEALPVVTTLSLSKGALMLAKNHVVVKRLSAVEDLGSIQVLCTDKTGTLTENVLGVSSILAVDEMKTLHYGALAGNEEMKGDTDPTDAFDLALFKKLTKPERDSLSAWKRIFSIPFDPNRRRTSVVVEKDGTRELIVRGAPETILSLSTITKDEAAKIHEWVLREGEAGRRTIAIATGPCQKPEQCEKEEKKLIFLGCISFVDPVKNTSKAAILDARRLGVRLVILTGDGPEVAGTVATEVGITKDKKEVITETEFLALPPEQQSAAALRYNVFARMSPAGKYRVIEILSKDMVVGYMGDGINDAPALKMASVGLVVANAADIAREAADVVLLNRSLHVIIEGIESGRSVFENTVKYLKTTLISSFGNFYTVAIAQLMMPFLPMLPIQLLLLNLLTDYPMIAIATDSVEFKDIKKPHRYNVRDIVLFAIVLGIVSTIFDFIYFVMFKDAPPAVLQTNWFIGSVLTELVLLYSIRTRVPFWKAKAPSKVLNILSLMAAALALILPFTGVGYRYFKFVPPTWSALLSIFAVVVVYFVTSEIVKLAYYRFWNHTADDTPRRVKKLHHTASA